MIFPCLSKRFQHIHVLAKFSIKCDMHVTFACENFLFTSTHYDTVNIAITPENTMADFMVLNILSSIKHTVIRKNLISINESKLNFVSIIISLGTEQSNKHLKISLPLYSFSFVASRTLFLPMLALSFCCRCLDLIFII